MEKINSLSLLYQLHSSFLKKSNNIAFLITALTHIIAISACLFSVTQADLIVVATQDNAPIAMNFIIANQAQERPAEQNTELNKQEEPLKTNHQDVEPNIIEEIVPSLAALETIKPKPIIKKKNSPKKVKVAESTPKAAKSQTHANLESQQAERSEQQQIAAQAQKTKQAQESRQTLLAVLVSEIEKSKHYPNAARKLGIEGVVNIIVQIDSTGNIVQSKLANDNSPPLLQKAALATMEKVQRNWVKLASPSNKSLSVTIPIRYALKS